MTAQNIKLTDLKILWAIITSTVVITVSVMFTYTSLENKVGNIAKQVDDFSSEQSDMRQDIDDLQVFTGIKSFNFENRYRVSDESATLK